MLAFLSLFLRKTFLEAFRVFADIIRHLVSEGLPALIFPSVQRILKFTEQLPLPVIQVFRHINMHGNEQIAAGIAAKLLNAPQFHRPAPPERRKSEHRSKDHSGRA